MTSLRLQNLGDREWELIAKQRGLRRLRSTRGLTRALERELWVIVRRRESLQRAMRREITRLTC